MKPVICVYAIALNEEKFVNRFLDSCKEADCVVVCDTGSSDKTVELLKTRGVTVYNITVNPWRFDTARNIALSLVPKSVDLCISLDLDECLQPGWREEIDKIWQENPDLTRIRYNYVWSWTEEKTPGLQFFTEKIHLRSNYYWTLPCHELLKYTGSGPEVFITSNYLSIHHYPDPEKSRGHYLNLLKLGVEENPQCDRSAHYYARELYFYSKYEESIKEFERHLSLPKATWDIERSSSRIYISKSYIFLNNIKKAHENALLAISESYFNLDAWYQLAETSYLMHDWLTCIWTCKKLLEINSFETKQAGHNVNIVTNNLWYIYDVLALSYHNLNNNVEAIRYGTVALNIAPRKEEARLLKNIEFYNIKK